MDPRTDTLNRRIRFAAPQPLGKRIQLSDGDIAVFEALHRHGPLPSNYLFPFSGTTHLNSFQHRLTKLYNGAPAGGYLTRPQKQFESFFANYQPIIYDLNDRSTQVLSELGRLSPFINRTDPFLHRLMGACFGASIELAARKARLCYLSRSELLVKKGNAMELPLSQFAARKVLVPDDVFALRSGDTMRFYAVEIDRNTESIERSKRDQNTFGKKIDGYLDVMQHRTYRTHWGALNLSVLIVTTNATHMENMRKYLRGKNAEFARRFTFKALPTFGANWRVPSVVTDILDSWVTANGATNQLQF